MLKGVATCLRPFRPNGMGYAPGSCPARMNAWDCQAFSNTGDHLLAGARHFLVASSTLVPEHQLTVANAVREGGHLHAITSERIMQELRRRNQILKDDSLRGRIELHCHSHVNMHLIVTYTHLFLALPRLEGTSDLENIIISKGSGISELGQDALLPLLEPL
jgi:predicted transcriptional regulator